MCHGRSRALTSYLKSVVIFGVPFGVMAWLMGSLGERANTLHYMAQGLLFGAGMGAWALWWTRRNRRRLEEKGIQAEDMAPRQEREIQVSLPPEVALDACVRVLKQISKAKVLATDASTGICTAQTGVTWRSFGERITTKVYAEGPGSRIRISSVPRMPTAMLDGGRGLENVETVRKSLLVWHITNHSSTAE